MQAKHALSEMFVFISKVKNIIDDEIYEALFMFHKLLSSNVKTGLLGRSSCNNVKIVSDSLIAIISSLTKRSNDIEKYIKIFSH